MTLHTAILEVAMYLIVEAESIAPDVRRIVVEAPKIAKKHLAGQFVIVRVTPDGERIPLTIAEADPVAGSITLFVQAIGRTTTLMSELEAEDFLFDVAGPIGRASEIKQYGTAVVVGGGLGTAIAYPIARALADVGNRVIAIIGGRSREYVLLEDQLAAHDIEVVPCTDDGSYGRPGFVTAALADIIEAEDVRVVFAAGPVPMMGAVAEVTRPRAIETIASLNPIMVDGTGMCGGCRVEVGGETKFACVDGPEFDAHRVDFGLLQRRNTSYRAFESKRLLDLESLDAAHLEQVLAPVRGACAREADA
ncbi:MAG: sulfide/dihydroorotate dehydrogenase-like FAD/NAD-binding protein [Acidimicrobiia bacterium]